MLQRLIKAELKEIKQDSAKPKFDHDAKRAEQPKNSRLTNFSTHFKPVFKNVLTPYFTAADKAALAQSCFSFNSTFEPELKAQAVNLMMPLLQAVTDDKREIVKSILSANHRLLLLDPKDVGITQVESKLTWQIFEPEYLLSMALKRNQVEMVKVLRPFFEKLEEKEAATALQTQWVLPEISAEKREKLEEALQEKYIKNLLLPLFDIIAKDKSARWINKDNLLEFKDLQANTENALEKFRNILLNDKVIKLLPLHEAINQDDYFDVIQLLAAAYKAYDRHYKKFVKDDQHYLYGICVVGFILTLAHPELAKMYCQSFYEVINSNQEICVNAEDLKLSSQDDYFRSSRDSLEGHGFNFACSIFGGLLCGVVSRGDDVEVAFEKLCKANASEFDRLRPRLPRKTEPADEPKTVVRLLVQRL